MRSSCVDQTCFKLRDRNCIEYTHVEEEMLQVSFRGIGKIDTFSWFACARFSWISTASEFRGDHHDIERPHIEGQYGSDDIGPFSLVRVYGPRQVAGDAHDTRVGDSLLFRVRTERMFG